MEPVSRIATIANGASLSNAIRVGTRLVRGFNMPTGWTAANLSFTGTDVPGGTHQPIVDSDGTELTVSGDDTVFISLTQEEMNLLSQPAEFKIRSGPSAAPVNQLAEREIKVVLG